MRNNRDKKNSFHGTGLRNYYEIKIMGHLDPQRSQWFEGMTLTYIEQDEDGVACTIISGLVIDQSALHGLLNKIRDLNLTLISVHRSARSANPLEEVPVEPEPPENRGDFTR